MLLKLNTRIGDPDKHDGDCETHQHKRVISTIILEYIKMIDIVDII
jgi:hypothetical protein